MRGSGRRAGSWSSERSSGRGRCTAGRGVLASSRGGELPGWPFAVYVWLTLVGLLLLGAGLLLGDGPGWAGWLTVGAGVLFLAGFVRFGDLPPFVFYVVLTMVGVAVL